MILHRDDLLRSLAEDSLAHYVRQAWGVLEPTSDYSHNWHIDAISEHLEAVSRNQIQNLIVNISPRCMKSLSVAVFWPTWTWIRNPDKRWLFATYAQSLTVRDSIKRRNLILSPWYQKWWGQNYALTKDQNAKVRFDNDRTGFMLATSVDGSATGEGGDFIVIDDPLKASEALSDASRLSVNTWWDQTMSTRLNSRKTGARVIIMQRLHEDDLVGHILERMKDGGTHYEHLMLPMEFEPDRKCFTSLGFEDPRTEKDELMWPDRFDAGDVNELKSDLGSYSAASQLQQRPAPAGGGLFKDHWWRFWIPESSDIDDFAPQRVTLPSGDIHYFEIIRLPHYQNRTDIQSWDAAFKGTTTSDYVAGLAIAIGWPNFYVMDQVHEKMDIIGTIKAIRKLSQAYPHANAKLIEDKANGPAIIQLLKGGTAGREMPDEVRGAVGAGIPGLIPYNPERDKLARASALAPIVEAGNVILPHPQLAPWVWDFIAEFGQFPFATNDDRVDALGQGVQYGLLKFGGKKKVRAVARA